MPGKIPAEGFADMLTFLTFLAFLDVMLSGAVICCAALRCVGLFCALLCCAALRWAVMRCAASSRGGFDGQSFADLIMQAPHINPVIDNAFVRHAHSFHTLHSVLRPVTAVT